MTVNYIDAAALFDIASHPVRLQVLVELCERDLMVYELVQLTGLDQSSLSQHLKRLRDFKLVTSRKRGKNVEYSAVPGLSEKLTTFTLRNFSS